MQISSGIVKHSSTQVSVREQDGEQQQAAAHAQQEVPPSFVSGLSTEREFKKRRRSNDDADSMGDDSVDPDL